MGSYAFRLMNVFTQGRGALTGNPLCVFDDAVGLDTPTMQALARQFNLSETTFILPSMHADAQVRIFTPSYEMAFAGHPTLGTAHVVRALKGGDSLVLEMQAGLIPVAAIGDRWTLTARAPSWRELDVSRGALAGALGLAELDIGERPLWIDTGSEQLIVPLNSADAVAKVSPQPSLMQGVGAQAGRGMAYVFASTGPSTVLARFFFAQDNAMLEDPATGSATANFGGWFLAMQRTLPVRLTISQGEFVKRPSTLYLDVDANRRIAVGGDVVQLAAGMLTL